MAQNAFVLILTPDEARGQRLGALLRDRHGHFCGVFEEVELAVQSIREQAPDLVVADAGVNGALSATALAEALDRYAADATLAVVGPTRETPATRHLHIVPVDNEPDLERLAGVLDQLASKAAGHRADRLLRKTVEQQKAEIFEGIAGTSPQIRRIVELIKKAARNKLTVLILGETGTGKELVARAIHNRSDRARRPFLPLNCAGVSETLLESTLFGHVKGAFTGAVADKKGFFAAADGGTLFLDEIGDTPHTMQAKLLRALDYREITPVGSTEIIRVDVRVIAATNADLGQLREEKKFREDLYYRLRHLVIEIPPLRERRQDIPILVHHLLQRANETHGTRCPGVSAEALGHLARYHWPGNVRELANLVEAIACDVVDRQIETRDLPEFIRGPRDIVPASMAGLVGRPLEEVERILIEKTLQATGGNREQAAKILNIGTRTLYRKIKEYGL